MINRRVPFSVFCDFDGTASVQDVTDLLLERLADPSWREIEAEWEAGKIGSRDCMMRQIPLIKGGWSSVIKVLYEVEIDPDFKPFVSWCAKHNISLTIVSEGIDRVISWLLNYHAIKIPVIVAGKLREDAQGKFSLDFPEYDSCRPAVFKNCKAGICKCMALRERQIGQKSVVIGDGRSDFCWSERADILFAKKSLANHALKNKIRHTCFTSFACIQAQLEKCLIEPETSWQEILFAQQTVLA